MAYYERWVASGGALKHLNKADRALGGRASLVWGNYIPDSTTVGITSAPTTLVTTNQNFNDMGAGGGAKIIMNTEFRCKVIIQGKNYVFINCLFSGSVAGMTETIVQLRYATSDNNVFSDCTFAAYTPTEYVNGIQGRGFTCIRCDFYCVVDGLEPAPSDTDTRTDVVIQQCFIHDLLRYSPSSTHGDNQTHSDSIQWMGGLGLTLLGNRIENLIDITKGTGNSAGQVGTAALMINALNNTIQPGELNMQKNWIRGGNVGINSIGVPSALTTNDGTIITGNRIMNDQSGGSNNRWVGYKTAGSPGTSTQTGVDNAISAGTNYAWDGTTVNAFAGSTITNWKVNINA